MAAVKRAIVYDLLSNKIVQMRSVVFTEDQTWNWESKKIVTISIPLSTATEIAECETQAGSQEESHFDAAQDTQASSSHSSTSTSDLESISQNSTPSSTPVKLKSMEDIYARCRMCIIKPKNYHEAAQDKVCQDAMNAEI